MYLRRKIDESLASWKADSSRKPLIVKGPRQVGKTESILHFARANYGNVIEINFLLDKKFIGIAERGYTADDIIESISLVDPSLEFVSGDTLIFFDEIQEVDGWAKACKTLRLDNDNSLFITGSNSRLLSREYTTEFSGRYIALRVRPFVYKEILEY